jgi:hypothetical protein
MSKYLLNAEFLDSIITTKTSDGTEIIVTSRDFNDSFAEMMIGNGQSHLVRLNPNYNVTPNEKKTFTQVSDTVISLTLNPLNQEELKQSQTVNEPTLKRKPGRQPKLKI